MIRRLLDKAITFVLYRPKLASTCVRILAHFPMINDKLISFASNEGLITHDHAPVPKQDSRANKNVNGNILLHEIEDDRLTHDADHEQYTPHAAKPKGKNDEEKSPLEKWFN